MLYYKLHIQAMLHALYFRERYFSLHFSFVCLFLVYFSYFCLCSFPHATDITLLAKFKQQHERNHYFVPTPVMEPAFVIRHFAGKVKYQIKVTSTTNMAFKMSGTRMPLSVAVIVSIFPS